MIAMWMLYAVALAVLFGCAAWLVERSLIQFGRPVRWVWVAALAGSIVMPVVLRLQPDPAPVEPVAPVFEFGQIVTGVSETVLPPNGPTKPTLMERVAAIDPVFGYVWLAGSVLTALALMVSHWRLRRDMARWPSAEIDGEMVRVSLDVGPAVVGAWRGFVVVPAWVRDLDEPQRRMILRHELEHMAAGDARLLAGAALAVVACPWNVGVWWLRARLRDAIEMDCDKRLVRGGTDWAGYATLLLDVAGREGGTPLAAIGLTPRRTLLSRRIAMLVASRSKTSYARAVAGVAAGALLTIAACEVPPPAAPAPDPVVSRTAELSSMPVALRGPALGYPGLLRSAGINGRVVLSFVVGPDGKVDPGTVQTVSTTHPGFVSPAVEGISGSFYQPATADGQPVSARVRQAILFSSSPEADQSRNEAVPAGFLAPLSVVAGPRPPVVRRNGDTLTYVGVETRSTNPTMPYQASYVMSTSGPVSSYPPAQGGFTYHSSEWEGLLTDSSPSTVPLYPPLLKTAGVEGKVEVGYVVDPRLRRVDPSKIVVISATNRALERAVVQWITKATYPSTLFDESGAPARARQTVTFRILRREGREPKAAVKVGTYWTPVKD